ncbi:helix-turn-helix transcriptional regulator [Streptomyces sp. LX-29]|uniref:MmyB family transcriptional regulator n=1 Tax=Streptomyces sp. LX-29 TaxID=2900152 RepID=UPI00240D3029|nr:XRE family transcriptional regulator [Streptomyces sp. LX-29]WFB10568.1 helix-turn-helix transcriptional regulator [Streptomyces sp. LX-29]
MLGNPGLLQKFLIERRAAIHPEDVGLTTRTEGSGRRAPGLSQTQVEELLGTHGKYARLERAALTAPPLELLLAVGRLFRLTEQEWSILWRYARGENPPRPLARDAGLEVHGSWARVVDAQTEMSYLNDAAWNVLHYNAAFAELFPDRRVPKNTMRWMLLAQEARGIMVDWATSWAPFIAPQLRAMRAARPANATLAAIERDVLADEIAGPIYRDGPDVRVHPDGDERPLDHPTHGRGWVTVCAASPFNSPDARLMVLPFRRGEQRPSPPAVLRADIKN